MKGLGKGLESLIPTDIVDQDFDLTAGEDIKLSKLTEISLAEIIPDPLQPRQKFDEEALNALASSIKEHGVLQPIVITRLETPVPFEKTNTSLDPSTASNHPFTSATSSQTLTPDKTTSIASSQTSTPSDQTTPSPQTHPPKYQIVAGERRWRAASLAGLTKIPAIIRSIDAQHRLELSIIENAQREDLNPIELATAYAKLKTQFNLTPKEIAKRVGKSDTSIVNTMRLLNLPDEAKHAMLEYNLSEGVMRPLASADPELIKKILPRIIEEGWTARRVERYIALHKAQSSQVAVKVNQYARREEALSEKYRAEVRVRGRSVTFSCKNDAELQKLLDKLA